MIVVDTSAWVDLFRDRRTQVASTLERLIEERADIAITETIAMEVLAGARTGEGLAYVRAQLIGRPILRLEGIADFEEAARIYRACHAAGETLRSQLDLLIAVPTIRHGASLLHNDRDFQTIARHSALKLEPVTGTTAAGERELRERKGHWKQASPRSRGARRERTRHAGRGAVTTTGSR